MRVKDLIMVYGVLISLIVYLIALGVGNGALITISAVTGVCFLFAIIWHFKE